jgi:cyclin-dependent kinase 7
MDQLKTIFRALGTPTEEDWPVLLISPIMLKHANLCTKGHTKLPDYVAVGQFPKTPLRDLFTAASADTLSLLNKCLTYEPRMRITAREVCHC